MSGPGEPSASDSASKRDEELTERERLVAKKLGVTEEGWKE